MTIAILASTFSLFRGYMAGFSPAAIQVYVIGLLGSFLATLLPLAILWFLDRREPKSRWLYLIAVLWGALIASGIAVSINHIFFKSFGDEGHALFTGLFGMGLGLARQTTRRWLRYAAPIGGWLLGFSAHFFTNMTGLLIALMVYAQTGQPMADVPATAIATPTVVQPFLNQWV